MRLAETIATWFGHVEIVLNRAEGLLHDGEDALARGDAMRARLAAKALLERIPQSPIGLALLADACEAAHLDAELAQTLEELAGRIPSQADVWVRLGRARDRVGSPEEEIRDAFLRALTVASPGSEARRETLLWLADLDLSHGDGARAELWLERIADTKAKDIAIRRAEARLLQDDPEGAEELLGGLEIEPTDGRAALLRGRTLAARGDAGALVYLVRAAVLDAPGASEALASALSWIPTDEAQRARVRAVVEGRGEASLTRWKAAFARAEGRRDEARAALVAAMRSGQTSAARPLLEMAVDDQDYAALVVALGGPLDDDPLTRDARKLPSPARAKDPGETAGLLDTLLDLEARELRPWADALRHTALAAWIPPSGAPSRWTDILTRLDKHARAEGDLEAIANIAALAVERARPVRVAIVGEFNAGKSTFINAIMGADIAPTGILPTTATLHHLRYAPDPFSRIQFAEPDPVTGTRERIVPSPDLRSVLSQTDISTVDRVEILMPLASLTRVELLDTPGFNAPDVRHTMAARGALEQADFAIWLLDATQPMKQSERAILEEAKTRDLPVQILVNKADRLSPTQLTEVMSNVEASLHDAGLASWSPPIPFSARKALQHKLGTAEAGTLDGWEAVQRLLDEQIIGRSDELKERGLRRHTAERVARLAERARHDAGRERLAIDEARARAQGLAQRAGTLEREANEQAQTIAGALTPAALAWQHDLDIIATGRERGHAARDPALVRYQVERATTHLAAPLGRVLASLARGGGPEIVGATEDDFGELARTLVRTFALAGGTGAALLPLAESAIATLSGRLLELAVRPAVRGRAEGRVAELDAIALALANRREAEPN